MSGRWGGRECEREKEEKRAWESIRFGKDVVVRTYSAQCTYPQGAMVQDPQWIPETAESTKRLYTMFFSYTHTYD